MFANSYQNGHYTEVWDSRVSVDKHPLYKQLFRTHPSSLKNFYDKDVKSFIYQLQGNQRLCFPADDKLSQLSLHQRYIVLQLFIPAGGNWAVQLGISDLGGSRKRVNVTTMQGRQELKYFSLRYPLEQGVLEKQAWMFLAFDLHSFSNLFKHSTFRSLDSLTIFSSCKLRRIFTMRQWSQFQIPKQYWLPSSIHQILQLIEFKQTKQTSSIINGGSGSLSTVQYSKMLEVKGEGQIGGGVKGWDKGSSSPMGNNDKGVAGNRHHNAVVKFPSLSKNPISKQQTPLKSSKLSQKIDLSHKQLSKAALLGKSDRSLTKAELIIQKSKLRLNTLQQQQEQILKRLKSEDQRFSDKVSKQNLKDKMGKSQNMFQSEMFRSRLVLGEELGVQSKMSKFPTRHSPKGLNVRKSFEEDNIFAQEYYSSSWSRLTEKGRKELKAKPKKKEEKRIEKNTELKYSLHSSSRQESTSPAKPSAHPHPTSTDLLRPQPLAVSRQQIIEEDLWTDNQSQNQQTPIQQVIQSPQLLSHSMLGQTLITKNNNKEIIKQQQLNNIQQTNQLELIYDEMIGCYYHPQTNTYYEIKKE